MMPSTDTKPIVCTLSSTAMALRLAQIRGLTRRYLRSHRLEGSTLRLAYDLAAAPELAEIVALERECCAFLDFELSALADAVELVIKGPRLQEGDTQWLFSQFLPEPQEPDAGAGCACCKG